MSDKDDEPTEVDPENSDLHRLDPKDSSYSDSEPTHDKPCHSPESFIYGCQVVSVGKRYLKMAEAGEYQTISVDRDDMTATLQKVGTGKSKTVHWPTDGGQYTEA